MKQISTLFLFFACFSAQSFAQVYKLDSTSNKSIITTCTGFFTDEGGSTSNYAANTNYTITFCRNAVTANYRYSFAFDSSFSILSSDSLFVYDGPDTLSPLLNVGALNLPYANNSNSLANYTVHPSASNVSGCLTFRFKSGSDTATGWNAQISCDYICQNFTIALDSVFYKVLNGTRTPVPIRFGQTDYNRNSLGEITDTVLFNSIDICRGDSIIVLAKTKYINNNQHYNQSDSTSVFTWKFGDNTSSTIHGSREVSHFYSAPDGYNLVLMVSDTLGCIAYSDTTRVRISWNPIRSVSPMPDMCLETPVTINVGYNSVGTQIFLDTIQTKSVRETYDGTVFIPDGPNCPEQCYKTSVTFNNYYPGAIVQSANDICSVCLNIEHSYAGDLAMYLICPTGQRTVLMTYGGTPNPPPGVPRAICNGGADFGIPNIGSNGCLPGNNPQGTPWNYCWSQKYLDQTQGTICQHVTQIQLDSSHYETKRKFYQPDSSFNSLIGCPLNGEWMIQVCDYYSGDNGYVFNWSLEFCNISASSWTYQVLLDTVIWNGPFIQNTNRTSAQLFPTSSGTFLYEATIIDSFGCQWDTNFSITVLPDLSVNLGNDTILCPNKSIQLNAANPAPNVQYLWDNGTISPLRVVNSAGDYWVSLFRRLCPERKIYDTIKISYFERVSLNLGNDTTICYPGGIQLNATPLQQGNFSYLWNTGATDSVLSVFDSGRYMAIVFRTECPAQIITDTVHISYYAPFSVNIGNDTIICRSDSIFLDATQAEGNFSYVWNNGNIEPTIFASKEGKYWVKVNRSECPNTILGDTITVLHIPKINVDLGRDDILCEGVSKILDATQAPGANAFYQWQDSSKAAIYTVWGKGEYWVSVYNVCEKKGDTVNITHFITPNLDFLPVDTFFCVNRPVYIEPQIKNQNSYSYKWSDGITTAGRLINKEGMYYLVVSNKCASFTDSLWVTLKDCDPAVIFPTAFTPNEYTNSYFGTAKNKNIKDFKILIYNRWGQEVFEGNSVDFKWFGKDKKGTELPVGAYVYYIEYTTIHEPGIVLQMKGVVNLLR